MDVVIITICIIIICIIVLLIYGKHRKNSNQQDVKLTGGALTRDQIDYLKRNFIPQMLIAGFSKLYQDQLNMPQIQLNDDSYKLYVYDENALKFRLEYTYPGALVDFVLIIDSAQPCTYKEKPGVFMEVRDSFTNSQQPVVVADTVSQDAKIVNIGNTNEIIIYHKIENGELKIRGVRFKLE